MNKFKGLFLFIACCAMNSVLSVKAQTIPTPLGVEASPTITFNTTLTTPYLNPPAVSGVINDPTDPAQTLGIVVDIKLSGNPITAANYTLTASSNKTSVVPNANVAITKADGNATIKITPAGVGYADITLTVTSGGNSKTLKINYGASAASTTPSTTFWHTGYSDASAAIALDSNYMVIGDDEINQLFVTSRHQSGLFVKSFDYSGSLALTDGSNEVDVEACVRSIAHPGRVYWTGSMSNSGSSNKYKPNSNTLFATDISGTGTATSFSVAGHYNALRQQLVTWGDNNNFNFTSSTTTGHDAKTIDGFNVEGITIAPDNTTLYIGFRAPLVPSTSATPTSTNRTMALIAPLSNFETWFGNTGSPSTNPTLGTPIKVDLGGRGIRDIVKLSSGIYIILAGNYNDTPIEGAVYQWTGNAADAPTQITSLDISSLNAEACLEIDDENGQIRGDRLDVISDNGSFIFYGDGTAAKDISDNTVNNYKKYRSDIILSPNNVVPVKIESFKADKQNASAVLNWEVASSTDIAGFEIMRSTDGKNFVAIQNQDALLGKTIYAAVDENPAAAVVYYQIKIIEKSGTIDYTTVQNLNFSGSKEDVNIYPNPVSSGSFTISNNQQGNKYVRIFDSKGALYNSFSFNNSSIDINTQTWAKGLYIIEIVGMDGNVQVRKAVMKQ